MSKATVVSTLPFKLVESKPGLFPFSYEIPAAPKDGISSLTVEDGYYLELIPLADERVPPRKVPVLSIEIARGLVEDYTNANLGISYDPLENGAVPIPGLFFLEGSLHPLSISKEHKHRVDQARMNTMAWFQRLVKIADDDWARNHQHKMITDLQRSAATFLGLKDREWNFDVFSSENALCWACKSTVNPLAMICSSCKAILKPEEYEKNKAKFADALRG